MVSRRLKLGGWRVVRVWESEIHQKLPILAEMIRLTVLHRSQMPRKAGR
jgi:G:T-mismatch repair DNA endonuclease (very short patch repair protein)